ncbi:MAG: ABC transporter substrate-binding protein [Rhodothermia bacterium]|nr:MAG: ABC transporter substrate-binding protein [Rhodothermia bacterium]
MYNISKPFLILVVFGCLLTTGTAAQQTADDIREMLEARDVDIKALVGTDDEISDEAREDLRSVINDLIDFRAMGEGALGRHWSKLTTEQQDEFVETFSKIVRTQSLARLDVYRADVVYDEITISDSSARVITTTTFEDVPTEVIYEMRFTGEEWLATDIILDEVSTVRGYARSFQSVIRKKGFDELMAKLRKKLAKVETSA